jgi:hypothetical protein
MPLRKVQKFWLVTRLLLYWNTQTNPKKEPRFQGEKIIEGVGSRMGRTSSRYGLSATATVFNGPVKKWKRKWVHVSPSPTLSYGNNNNSNGHNDQNNNGSRLLLCRWTLLSPAAATSTTTEDPPKHKFRYTPVSKTQHGMGFCQ